MLHTATLCTPATTNADLGGKRQRCPISTKTGACDRVGGRTGQLAVIIARMREVLCERCEFIIGMGCACPSDGSTPKARPEERNVRQEWRRFPGHAILIKQGGKAHVPGACDHMTEDEVKPPRWGWIPDPPQGLWGRIGESSPAIATAGNTGIRAVARCQSCLETLS